MIRPRLLELEQFLIFALLDHPKVTSKSIGEVLLKWDLSFDKFKLDEETNFAGASLHLSSPTTMTTKVETPHDPEALEKLSGLTISEVGGGKLSKNICGILFSTSQHF